MQRADRSALGEGCIEVVGRDQRTSVQGQDGIEFLTRCEAAGITLVNCDPYVREWIIGERSGK